MSEETIEYKGAKFYRCALQVNPHTYRSDYRGGKEYNEDEYNKGILEKCRENNIRVVGLADHGNVASSESLRQYLNSNEITVFPGFEIPSSEKIHVVCLYDENIDLDTLNQYLGALMGENPSKLKSDKTHPSSLSCQQIAGKVLNDQNGFWFAAHATNNNGILRLDGSGGNYKELWKSEELLLAIQIPGEVTDLDVEQEDLKKYREIIENSNPYYKRQKPIAILNAKDVYQPEDLSNPSASCLVKMTEPGFNSFKNAFFDPASRIRLNHDIVDTHYSCVKSIRWRGAGFYQDNGVAFSENLNTVIGGRGTGKSTLLESIRFALALPIEDSGQEQQIDKFRKNVLDNSQVTLEVFSQAQHGQAYTISRRYGEAPVVSDADGNISHLQPQDIMPDIELLGQNEILDIERDEDRKLDLLRRFLPDNAEFDGQLRDIRKQLEANRIETLKVFETHDQLSAIVGKEPKLQEQKDTFAKLGIVEKLKNVQRLNREQYIKDRISEQFQKIDSWLSQYDDLFELSFLDADDIQELPNKEPVLHTRELLRDMQTSLNALVGQIKKINVENQERYQEHLADWKKGIASIKDELNQAIARLPDQAGKSGAQIAEEYQKTIRELGSIERAKQQLPSAQQKQQIEKEREQLLERYRDTAFNRFTAMNEALKTLNRRLKGKIKITVQRCANKDNLINFLLDLPGIGEGKVRWLYEVDDLDLLEWSRWIADQDRDSMTATYKKYGLSSGTADSIVKMTHEQRLKLQEIELKDMVKIELNTAAKQNEEYYVPLERLSTGQKCTAILHLMLLSRDAPLIIDQPEDNLDNAFIAERIVENIRMEKAKRQFIFATHNANIPVFGDAELIVVLTSGDGQKPTLSQGSIDQFEIKQSAAEILEGGKHAFILRKDKYGF